MGGVSSAVGLPYRATLLEITIEEDEYAIEHDSFTRNKEMKDEMFVARTEEVLACFRALEKAVIARQSVTLTPEICREQLKILAKEGLFVYRTFFDKQAREILKETFADIEGTPNPTFRSEMTLFPWEVLYEGSNSDDPDPEMFWGVRYAPARIVNMVRIAQYAKVQELPADMLFCLHHELRVAFQEEWPRIEQIVKKNSSQGLFRILGPVGGIEAIADSRALLKYLNECQHNMVHFACHCRKAGAGADVLQFSLLSADANQTSPIELDTALFIEDEDGHFSRQPLVFLNACHSGGGGDVLRQTYNLPRKFINRKAGAVIATACSVPDIFAAQFAEKFFQLFMEERLTIGEALRRTRLHFLSAPYYNPLGLAYGLYSPAHYRLAPPPIAGDIQP